MNVLVNAASLKMGGGLTYLEGLLKALPAVAPQHRFIVYVTEEVQTRLSAMLDTHTVSLRRYPFRNTAGASRLHFDQVMIPRLAREYAADVLYSATGFGTFASPCPQVLLIHNPIYFNAFYKGYYSNLDRGLPFRTLRRWWTLLSIRASDVITFPTAAMRDMVAKYTSLQGRRTEVLHYGVTPPTDADNSAPLPVVVTQMAQWRTQGFALLLNVSLYSVHKNFETVLEAMPLLKARGHKLKLVLTVPAEEQGLQHEEFNRFLRRIKTLGLEDVVVCAGHVRHEHVGRLYEAADVFVFPSFTESFGYPMVEAMLARLPSVAADTPVNREMLGESATFFQTFDVQDCAARIDAILRDPGMTEAMKDAAEVQAKKFSWEAHTRSFVTVLESLVAPRRQLAAAAAANQA